SEAHDAYRHALRLAPERLDIWQSVAQHEFVRFQRQLLWKHLQNARYANDRVLKAHPTDVPSIRRGVRIAMLDGDYATVDSLVQAWEEIAPDDPWGKLVRGMLFADDGAWERAQESFARGLALLPERERRPFSRLDVLNPKDEEMRMESPDRLRFARDFWKWRDPTPADALNPRLLEHYRRMVQAELLFALESYHLHGWNHAPGEMLVRYGVPWDWTFPEGFGRGRIQEYRVTVNALVASRSVEIPYGPDRMPIMFVDYNQNGRFFYPIEGWPTDEELHLVEYPTAYHSPVALSRDQEVEVWRFQDAEGRGRIEVAVALSRRDWKEVLDRPYRLATKLTVYDRDWEEGDARIGSWAPFTVDALGRLIARFEADAGTDSLILGLETADRDATLRAAGYATVPPRTSGDGLELSDLAFVSKVSFERPGGAYGWSYGSALPNPGHRYRAGDAIGIAFEGYGLEQAASGDLSARIRVSVARQTRTGWLRVVLGKRKSGEAELIFDASEPGSTLHQLLALELPPLDSGTYQLRLHVEDRNSGKNAERIETFQILERGWKP
ncbi:MAG TPA: GWxTD domain-containing protein, partial [Candidatus Eisenbacteria bacterium]|nr:GWxTD domain-containing protein [Candidatus Eisenbacteria bacterium]